MCMHVYNLFCYMDQFFDKQIQDERDMCGYSFTFALEEKGSQLADIG